MHKNFKQSIFIYNSAKRKKEPFITAIPDHVRMYICGITPYSECHLGHARCYVFFDTLRRFFAYIGYDVFVVQNFTDIDDKIIDRARIEGISTAQLSQRFMQDYFHCMQHLNVLEANKFPLVTACIASIVRWIEKLVQDKFAYVTKDGDVFFCVRKFQNYGKLSGKNIDQMLHGHRKSVHEEKHDYLDFAIWKAKKTPDEPAWGSPWGEGRPGWHIECSVMAEENLGMPFDIHGGGLDLIFPHHENEIAIAETCVPRDFVRYWVHSGLVTVNHEKMSKSSGNDLSLKKILKKYPFNAIRLFLLSSHYRSPLDYSEDLLQQVISGYLTLLKVNDMAHFILTDFHPVASKISEEWENRFLATLCDDCNTQKAISVIFNLKNSLLQSIQENQQENIFLYQRTLESLCMILGIVLDNPWKDHCKLDLLKQKLSTRLQYRQSKNWKQADVIKHEITSLGYTIEDYRERSVLIFNRNIV